VGEWATNEIGYLRANRLHCDLCGQPLAGKYWTAAVDGVAEKAFCDPAHEQKYLDYWLPRYGGRAAAVS
jgi:hypothetical protein